MARQDLPKVTLVVPNYFAEDEYNGWYDVFNDTVWQKELQFLPNANDLIDFGDFYEENQLDILKKEFKSFIFEVSRRKLIVNDGVGRWVLYIKPYTGLNYNSK
jgi:hypothetical protein